MPSFKSLVTSSVGQKFLMALTGLGLVGFVIAHLLGNILLYFDDGAAFNEYAYRLESMGILLYIAEIGLIALFGTHIVTGILVKKSNKAARPEGYVMTQTKGGPSKSTWGSRNMILTGLVLGGFVVFHVWQMKFGPGVNEGYVTLVGENEVRDLHRLVYEVFSSPVWVILYVAVMILLGFHVRHGFWSLFQSLGVAFPKYSNLIYLKGLFIALFLAVGFLGIPIWIFIRSQGAF